MTTAPIHLYNQHYIQH